MARGTVPLGDSVVISTVASASPVSYPLARLEHNYTYEDVSDQTESRPNQPTPWPLSFHGGLSYSVYDPQQAGVFLNINGMICHEPNVIRAPIAVNNVTLTGAAAPPMYYIHATVSDGGDDDGQPVLYIISVESGEVNVYRVSLAHGYTATGTGVTTSTASTLEDARASWVTNEWAGRKVYSNSKEMTIASNTATVLTGGTWDVDPGDGQSYKIGVGDFGTLVNTKTFTQTTTQPMGHPAHAVDVTALRLYLGLGDNGKIQELTTPVSGTANDSWTASDADARQLVSVANRLYRSTDKNKISILARYADPLTEANWGDDFQLVGKTGSAVISELLESGGLEYSATVDGFWEWDTIGEPHNVFPSVGPSVRGGQGSVWFEGGFLIPTESGLWWTLTGDVVGPDSNPNNSGNDPSKTAQYFKQGRWQGLVVFGKYVWGMYVDSTGIVGYVVYGRKREDSDPPGWGPIIWHSIDSPTADLDDFHGMYVTHTSEFSATETKPTLWYANGNNVRYIWLEKDGSPMSKRGSIDLGAGATVTSGRMTFNTPMVDKQMFVIEGWAEDFGSVNGYFLFRVYRDGGTVEDVGATITADGYFRRLWTQDDKDTGRSMNVAVAWVGASSLTSTNGPHLRDVMIRPLPLPTTTRSWTFLFAAEDGSSLTSKKIRSDLEGYKNDLKKFKLPDEDTFNGVLTGIRLLRADEISELKLRNQEPPKYALACTVREMLTT